MRAPFALAPVLVGVFANATPALADEPSEADIAELRQLAGPPGRVLHLFGTAAFGTGLRFNNPYRLSTELGGSAESVSLTSGYFDLGLGATFGTPKRFQHGAALHLSLALAGVKQQVVTPSYLLAMRPGPRFLAYARAGTPVIVYPDANLGGEAALGGAFYATAKLGLTAEVVGDLFYGAGTPKSGVTTYPLVAFQIGFLIDHEVLP